MHQCRANPYNLEFDREHAQNDLDYYQLNGPKENSRPLVRIMDKIAIPGQSLLDVGGGIGAVTFELFIEGIRSAVLVDISSAYVETFREEAELRQLADRTMSFCGDFLDIHQKLDRMPNKLNWTAYSNKPRLAIVEKIKTSILTNGGYIVHYNQFSDLALTLTLEIEGNKITGLHKAMHDLLKLSELEFMETSLKSDEEWTILLYISFTRATGRLKSEIPAVPG